MEIRINIPPVKTGMEKAEPMADLFSVFVPDALAGSAFLGAGVGEGVSFWGAGLGEIEAGVSGAGVSGS